MGLRMENVVNHYIYTTKAISIIKLILRGNYVACIMGISPTQKFLGFIIQSKEREKKKSEMDIRI